MSTPLQQARLTNAEHEIQLHLIKEIDSTLQAGGKAEDLVARLRAWNRAHCASEELLMRRHAYPELDAHAAEHRKMATALDALITSSAAEALSVLMRRHIRERDAHLHAYLDQLQPGIE